MRMRTIIGGWGVQVLVRVIVVMVVMASPSKAKLGCGGSVGAVVDVDVGVVGDQGGWQWRRVTAAWGELRHSGASDRSDRSGVQSETLQGARGMVWVEG